MQEFFHLIIYLSNDIISPHTTIVVEQLDVNTFQKNIWIENTIHKVAPSS